MFKHIKMLRNILLMIIIELTQRQERKQENNF